LLFITIVFFILFFIIAIIVFIPLSSWLCVTGTWMGAAFGGRGLVAGLWVVQVFWGALATWVWGQ